MKSVKFTLFLATLLCFAINTSAQDLIYKKNDEVLKGKITEVGVNEVKYIPHDNPDGPVYAISKTQITRVRYANGAEEFYNVDPYNPQFYLDQKKRAIKWQAFSPLTGHMAFGYEQTIKPGFNLEIEAAYIGMGWTGNAYRPKGAWLSVGPKIMFKKDFYIDGMRYSHVLQGGYFKPEILFSTYGYDYTQQSWNGSTYTPFTTKIRASSGALMFNLGKQWILGDVMTLDIHGGVGYGFTDVDVDPDPNYQYLYGYDRRNYHGGRYFSHIVGNNNFPIAAAAGFSIGWLIK